MLITKSISKFDSKHFKKKTFLIIIIFVLSALFFTYIGIKLKSTGSSYPIKKFIIYDFNYKLAVIKNIIKKPFIKIDKIYLDISFKNLTKIEKNIPSE